MDGDASDSSAHDPWAERVAPRATSPRPPVTPAPGAGGTAATPGPTVPAGPGAPTMTSARATAPVDTATAPRRRPPRWVVEWAVVLVVALGVAVAIRAFVVQTFYIPSASMEPTLLIGDRILVDKVSYRLHDVHRGDIVVFGRPPGESSTENIKDLVKRVVGLPGDWIWSTSTTRPDGSSKGTVWVQGPETHNKPLEVPEPVKGTQLGQPIVRQKVPAGEFFVMGDNRTNSSDSRFFGPIPRSLIVGRVVMRIWPLSHLGFF